MKILSLKRTQEDEDDPAKNVDSKDELWQEMKGFNCSKKNEVRGYN